MSEFEPAHGRADRQESGSISVPLVVGASVLAGLGLFTTAYWLITFQWLYFGGVGLVALGAFLLFTRATGADRA